METILDEIVADRRQLPLRFAVRSVSRCVVRTGVLLSPRAILQPTDHVGQLLRFSDGSGGRIHWRVARRRWAARRSSPLPAQGTTIRVELPL
jgi:hypothetical protein